MNYMNLVTMLQSMTATKPDTVKAAIDTTATVANQAKEPTETSFLKFLDNRDSGLLELFLCLVAAVLLIQWLAWIFSIGRFRADKRGTKTDISSLRYIFANLLVKIIDDFRHFLALIVVTIFALALGYTLLCTSGDMDNVKDALQVVMATLGGLVGSILGYYFGESAARKSLANEEENKSDEPKEVIEKPPRQAPPPPKSEPPANPDH